MFGAWAELISDRSRLARDTAISLSHLLSS